MRVKTATIGFLLLALVAGAADARPRGRGGRDEMRSPPPREVREKMLQKVHTLLVTELGSVMGLDTEGTVRLAGELQPFHQERTRLRLEMGDSMRDLHSARRGETQAEVVAIARKLADTRVKLAELDRKELEAILERTSPEKAAEVALFLTHFPRRMERMAREIRGRHSRSSHHDGGADPAVDE